MLLLVSLTLALLQPWTDAVPIDIKPGNFTPELDAFKGPCPNIKPDKLSDDKSAYTGIWYWVGTGYSESQVDELSCAMRKIEFNDEGDFIYTLGLFESDVYKTAELTWTKQSEKGRYDYSPNGDVIFKGNLYYVDSEIFVFSYVGCPTNNNTYHFNSAAVGVRSLRNLHQKLPKILGILKKLTKNNEPKVLPIKLNSTNWINAFSSCNYPLLENSDETEVTSGAEETPDEEPPAEETTDEEPSGEETATEEGGDEGEPATEAGGEEDTTEGTE